MIEKILTPSRNAFSQGVVTLVDLPGARARVNLSSGLSSWASIPEDIGDLAVGEAVMIANGAVRFLAARNRDLLPAVGSLILV